MAPNNDDAFPSHPSNLDNGFPAAQIDVAALAQLNTTNIPRTAADTSVYASDAMTPLTDQGTVVGDQTVPATTQLQVLGPAVVDGTLNSRGGAQFAEPGSAFNEFGKRAIAFDRTGSLLVQGTAGLRAVLGDYGVTKGTVTAKTSAGWTGSLPLTVAAGANVWTASVAFLSLTLAPADLPAYDGNFSFGGTVEADTVSTDATYGGTQVRAHLYSSIDSGVTWVDQGILGSAVDAGAAGHTTSVSFATTVNLGTGTNIMLRIFVEAYRRVTSGGGGTGGGGGVISL